MGYFDDVVQVASGAEGAVAGSFAGQALLGPVGQAAGAVAGGMYGINDLYHQVSNILMPGTPDLKNPAGNVPSRAQAVQDQLAATKATEIAQSKSSSLLPFSEGLDSGSSSMSPMTTSRVLLGS